jgi:hypothetical protein
MIMENILRLKQFVRKHPLVISVIVLTNLLVLVNAVLHHPKIGYDVTENITYMQILPTRLPTPEDTSQFFGAPLPYILPSLVDKVCGIFPIHVNTCRSVDGKIAQILNVFLSIGIAFILWKIAELLRPGSETFKLSLFAVLGILTVYYRTFSQARGEPYVAFFLCLGLLFLLRMLKNRNIISWKDGVRLGLVFGLLILSRQWSFLIFPAVGLLALILLWKEPAAGWRFTQAIVISWLTAGVIGGWFYLHLLASHGTITAFNREPTGFSFSNQPRTFYLTSGLKHGLIFKQPSRPTFDNRFVPIFYSDTWGDYWCFFTCIRNDLLHWTANQDDITPYMGRVNLLSLFPTALLFGGMVTGGFFLFKTLKRKPIESETLFLGFLFLGVLSSLSGFLWFVISYPIIPTGVTIKATYMIQIFMILPILTAFFLEKVYLWKPALYWASLTVLLLVFLHNLPALVTRFVFF